MEKMVISKTEIYIVNKKPVFKNTINLLLTYSGNMVQYS